MLVFRSFTTHLHVPPGSPFQRDTLPQAQKRKSDSADNEMVPFRLVAESIPHRNKDIKEEKRAVKYFNTTGSHSTEIWKAQWGEMNNWEVWRALGKEHYKR